MIPLPFELAVIIDGSVAVVAVVVRAALRDHRSASPRPQLPGRSREAAPLPARAVPVGEAAGLAALISGVMTASGITAGLWMSGQARTACQSLVLAAAAVLVAGAGYAGGLRPPGPSAVRAAGAGDCRPRRAAPGADVRAAVRAGAAPSPARRSGRSVLAPAGPWGRLTQAP